VAGAEEEEPQPSYHPRAAAEEEEARPSLFASAHPPRLDRPEVEELPVYLIQRVRLRRVAATSSETSSETTNETAADVCVRRRASRLYRAHRTAHAAVISNANANATMISISTANANAVRILFSTATDSSTGSGSNRVDLSLDRRRVHDDPRHHRLAARTRGQTHPSRVRTPSRALASTFTALSVLKLSRVSPPPLSRRQSAPPKTPDTPARTPLSTSRTPPPPPTRSSRSSVPRRRVRPSRTPPRKTRLSPRDTPLSPA